MKFKFIISKLANQFFFISNLTEWHFSCEKEYNGIWLKKTGVLSNKERRALKEFCKILKKYGFKKKKDKVTWLGTPFITSFEKEGWQNVREWVSEEEYKGIREIFEIFRPRFEKIWAKEVLKLERAKELLIRESISKDKRAKRILSDLSRFYKKELPQRTINIYLLAIPEESSGIGGGAVLEEKGITLEVRDLKDIHGYILVITHEIAHSFLEKDSIEKVEKITRKFKFPSNKLIREREKTGLISELILCSLVPGGYLAERYFNIPIQKPREKKLKGPQEAWRSLVKFITFYLYPLAQKYIETERSLDREYIVAAIKLTREFFKKYKEGNFN